MTTTLGCAQAHLCPGLTSTVLFTSGVTFFEDLLGSAVALVVCVKVLDAVWDGDPADKGVAIIGDNRVRGPVEGYHRDRTDGFTRGRQQQSSDGS